MTMSCKPVTFHNHDGLKLFGMVHLPESGEPSSIPIILLSPGIKSRVAPHRLYIKLARHLARMGFVVLRFDFSGLGDSEGNVEEAMVADFYGAVQTGRYVSDTRAAMDWMQQEYKASRFILGGLCGGAITGLLTGTNDQRVISLFGFGIPVILDSTRIDPTKYLTGGELNAWRQGYLAKLTDSKSWRRLLTLKSNYRVIVKALMNWPKSKKVPIVLPASTAGTKQENNFNPLFPDAFEAMVSSRKVLLIFSEADRLYWIFQERFAQPYHANLQHYHDNFEVYLVKDANHVFSFTEWQQDMLQQFSSWLGRNYGQPEIQCEQT